MVHPRQLGRPGAGGGSVVATAAPGANDDVILDGTAPPNYNNSLVDQSFIGIIKTLTISGQPVAVTLNLTRSLAVTEGLTQSNGTIYAQGHQLSLGGTSNWTGGGISNPSLIIAAGAALNKSAAAGMNGGSITNNGTLNLGQNSSVTSVTNNGNLNLSSNGGSTISVSCLNNGTITSAGNSNINNLENKGQLQINGGELVLGGSFAKQTVAAIGTAKTIFNGGSLRAFNVTYLLQAGELHGSAAGSTITGALDNIGGTVYAGGTTGTLEVQYYYQRAGGTLVIGVDVNGGTNSQLRVLSLATLGGKLEVNWTNGVPAAGAEYEVARFDNYQIAPVQGDFTTFTSTGTANPVYSHLAGTWKPYKIKLN